MKNLKQVAPGIRISKKGEATIDPKVANVLFDLAIKLEEPTDLPVDVEHVMAAVVMLSREGRWDPQVALDANDEDLVRLLLPKVKMIFSQFGGKIGEE
ncbi:MAG: hypothetical protein P8J27_09035 [Mariniblastus sp.]|nr:hypothetical protein [Mariniblastus sp.]